MSTPAGWYPDPYDPSRRRWWTGSAWGDQTQDTAPSVGPPPAQSFASQPSYAEPSYTQPDFAVQPVGYQGIRPAASLAMLPVVSPWGRLGARVLEAVLVIVTLGIGWLFWAATLADKGQTPAKKVLGHRVIMDYTAVPASFARMLFLRGIVAGFIANWAVVFTLGIILLMPFWDSKNRNLWDHLSSTRVVYDPSN